MKQRQFRQRVSMFIGASLIATMGLAGATTANSADVDSVDLCAAPQTVETYSDGIDSAEVRIITTNPTTCLRTYRLTSDRGVLKQFKETAGDPVLRTGSVVLDGMYALALHEEKLLQRDEINTGNYRHGDTISCNPEGVPAAEQIGCYITGKNWSYIWTRDLAYAADLGMSSIDPIRMRNTLDFKLSERRNDAGSTLRNGGDLQVIQDQGTGGSYPNSTDRVSWAVGADTLLKWLPSPQREAFAARSLESLRNTIEHDRHVVYNPKTGLYMGETSYLDWRQQTYPAWTADDVTDIATSESLSTSITHWKAIELTARLSQEAGLAADAAKYQGWADELAEAIRSNLWLEDKQQFSQMLSNELNLAPAERYDALATALAVVSGVATEEQAAAAIANYPHTFTGPSVIWPQQQDGGSYHNEGVWPFVTAYMLRAGAQVGNDTAVTRHYDSMIRTAAIFGTNWENMNILTTGTDTRLNSEYQTWSVAGSMGMFQDVMFGVQAEHEGLRFAPYLTAQMRQRYLSGVEKISLSNIDYRGKKIDVVLNLPEDNATAGSHTASAVRLNGNDLALDTVVAEADFAATNFVEIDLGDASASVDAAPIADTKSKEGIYGPRTPEVELNTTGEDADERVELTIGFAGEDASRIEMDVIRDGKVVAANVPATTTWVDETSDALGEISYCYVVRTRFVSSGNASHDSKPQCYWGPNFDRVLKVEADDLILDNADDYNIIEEPQYGRMVQEWGNDDEDTLSAMISPSVSGLYLVQTQYLLRRWLQRPWGDWYRLDLRDGVDSGMKRVKVFDTDGDVEVASGIIFMPRTASEFGDDNSNGSTFVPARLEAGKTYRIELSNDEYSSNMSYWEANAIHNDHIVTNSHWNAVDLQEVKALLKQADGGPVSVDVADSSDTEGVVGQPAAIQVEVSGGLLTHPSDISATVDLGDGTTTSDVNFVANTNGTGYVGTAQHSYAAPGEYDVEISVDVDGSATVAVDTEISIRGNVVASVQPAAPNGANGWYNSEPVVTLEAPGSATAQYRLSEQSAWANYSSPVTIADGHYDIAVRSLSANGHEGAAEAVGVLNVDTGLPTAAGSVTHAEKNATISVTAADALSGVAGIEVKLPGASAWVAYSSAVTVARTANKQTVQIRATDRAGNQSVVSSVAVEALTTQTMKPGTVKLKARPAIGKRAVAVTAGWPAGAQLSYQWLADGKPIKGATTKRVKLPKATRGSRISVRVTATLANHAPAASTSNASKWRILSGKVNVKGKKRVGKKLRVKVKGWKPKAAKYKIVWRANGKVIKRAKNKKALAVTANLRGKRITVRVVAKKPGFTKAVKNTKVGRIARR